MVSTYINWPKLFLIVKEIGARVAEVRCTVKLSLTGLGESCKVFRIFAGPAMDTHVPMVKHPGALVPQPFAALTHTSPNEAPQLTDIDAVPCPLKIVDPDGTLQV